MTAEPVLQDEVLRVPALAANVPTLGRTSRSSASVEPVVPVQHVEDSDNRDGGTVLAAVRSLNTAAAAAPPGSPPSAGRFELRLCAIHHNPQDTRNMNDP